MSQESQPLGKSMVLHDEVSAPSPRMLPLCLAVSVVGLGQSMLFTLLPILAAESRIGAAGLSLVMTAGILAFFLAAPLWGRLADRLGRRGVMLGGSLVLLLGHAGFLLVLEAVAAETIAPETGLFGLLAARVVYGAASAALFPLAQAWVGDVAAESGRLRGLAGLSAAMTAGRLLGPPLAAALTVLAPLLPLYALLAAALLAFVALLFLPAPPRAAASAEGGTGPGGVFLALAGVFLLTTMLGQLQFTLGLHVQTRLGLDATASVQFVALLLTLGALAALTMQLLLARRLKSGRAGLLGLLCLLASAGCGTLAWGASAPHFIIGVIAVGTAVSVAFPIGTAVLLALAGTARRGRVMGVSASAQTLGYACGALLGGLYAWAPTASFALAALAPLLAFLLLRAGMVRARDPEKGRA